MNTLSGPELQRALEAATRWCFFRFKGIDIGEHDLERLGFGSVEGMGHQLRSWGLPEWLIGAVPGPDAPTKERRARGGNGEREHLPRAARAKPLFREMLDQLAMELEGLSRRVEYIQDGRFIVGDEWDSGREVPRERMPVFRRYYRTDPPTERWLALCEERGLDPEAEHHDVWVAPNASRGGSASPPEPLLSLCALYVIRGGDPEDLIGLLHPDPPNAPRERLFGDGGDRHKGIVKRLREEALRIAMGVRGGTLRTGRKGSPISEDDHAVAAYVTRRRRRGVPDARILEELEDGALESLRSVSRDDLKALGKLRLD